MTYNQNPIVIKARAVRNSCGAASLRMPCMIKIFTDFFGKLKYEIKIVDYDASPVIEAFVDPQNRVVTVRSDVWEDARRGVGRARFTLAEEVGHAALGHSMTRHRKTQMSISDRAHDEIRADERDAKEFAAHLLMPLEMFNPGMNVSDVESIFGVSFQAAGIQLEKYKKLNRQSTGERRPLPPSVIDFLKEAKDRGIKVERRFD